MTATATAESMYLVPPETVVERPGEGAAFELGALAAQSLLLALRVEEILEQESLQVSVWGSGDGKDWGATPLFLYPERFYAGTTPAALDLSQRPEVKFLEARWQVNRWGRGYPVPRFRFSLKIQYLAGH